MPATLSDEPTRREIAPSELKVSSFSLSIHGDPPAEIGDLIESIRTQGILAPLVVVPEPPGWEVVSGHRRLACARALDLATVPCEIRHFPSELARRLAVLEYNRQRRKTFSQTMRQADALEEL